MEYKIFGPGGSPAAGLKDDLAALAALDDKQRAAIAEWFLGSQTYDPWEPSLPSIIAASTLLPEQFRQCAVCVRGLLISWHQYGLELTDIERDLLLLGLPSEQLRVIVDFLRPLSVARERVWAEERIRLQNFVGLPTIDDVNLTLDARPVFGGDAFEYTSGNADERAYQRLIGFTNLVMMEILSSDISGQKQRAAIQMTEETFKSLTRAVNRVNEQLAILKTRTSKMVQDA